MCQPSRFAHVRGNRKASYCEVSVFEPSPESFLIDLLKLRNDSKNDCLCQERNAPADSQATHDLAATGAGGAAAGGGAWAASRPWTRGRRCGRGRRGGRGRCGGAAGADGVAAAGGAARAATASMQARRPWALRRRCERGRRSCCGGTVALLHRLRHDCRCEARVNGVYYEQRALPCTKWRLVRNAHRITAASQNPPPGLLRITRLQNGIFGPCGYVLSAHEAPFGARKRPQLVQTLKMRENYAILRQ